MEDDGGVGWDGWWILWMFGVVVVVFGGDIVGGDWFVVWILVLLIEVL